MRPIPLYYYRVKSCFIDKILATDGSGLLSGCGSTSLVGGPAALCLIGIFFCGIAAQPADETKAQTADQGRTLLIKQAADLRPLMHSSIGRSFLEAVEALPEIQTRIVYYDAEGRVALSESELKELDAEAKNRFKRLELDEHYYYFTRYGSPLAFARAFDLVGMGGLDTVAGKRVVDFGFGSIGHLRILAGLGADTVGIEVDSLLQKLYAQPKDTGSITRHQSTATEESDDSKTNLTANGHLKLLFGQFPAEEELTQQLDGDVDLFISKNTLKRGYIHPEREVDPKRLVHLGVDDETFVRTVYDKLRPGGYFMIYNLHPAPAPPDKPYIPWADGRSPFDRELFEKVGFQLLSFDVDDTPTARQMGKALKWDEQMDLDNDLFGTYTLVQKPSGDFSDR